METTSEILAERVRVAKRDMERAKILFANKLCTYAQLEAAARLVCDLTFEYQRVKFPKMRAKKIPFQAMLR